MTPKDLTFKYKCDHWVWLGHLKKMEKQEIYETPWGGLWAFNVPPDKPFASEFDKTPITKKELVLALLDAKEESILESKRWHERSIADMSYSISSGENSSQIEHGRRRVCDTKEALEHSIEARDNFIAEHGIKARSSK